MAAAGDTLDTRGMICPIPALKARKRLAQMAPGHVLQVVADDPAAATDIPELCRSAGHRLAATDATADSAAYVFTIEAWGDAAASGPDAEPA